MTDSKSKSATMIAPFRHLADSIPQIVWVATASGDLIYVNARGLDYGGITPADVHGWGWTAFFHPEDLPAAMVAWKHSIETGDPLEVECRVRRADGAYRWHMSRAVPMRDDLGRISEWFGTLTDIESQKAQEAALREASEALRLERDRFADIMRTSSNVVHAFRIRPDGTYSFLYASPHISELLGLSADELAADAARMLAFLHPDDVPRIVEMTRTSRAKMAPWHLEFRVLHPTRGEIWVESHTTPRLDPDGSAIWSGVMHDITDRKRAEEERLAARAEMQSMVETAPGLLMRIGRDRKIQFINRLFTHHSQEDVIGTDAFLYIPPESHERARAALDNVFANAQTEEYETAGPPDESGTRHWYLVRVGPIVRDGVIVAATLFATDITARRNAELALVESEAQQRRARDLLASVLESTPDPIITIDTRGIIRSVNPATSRAFGYSAEELLGNNVTMLMPEGIRPAHDRFLERAAKAAERPVFNARDLVARRKDGTTFYADLSVTTVQLDGQPHFTGVVRDLTERRTIEEQFRQAHKMEAIGHLAGGVAHDFNNLLTIILGEIELVLESLPVGHLARTSLSDMRDAGWRGASLTRQLLAFSRKTVLEPKVVDLNEIVEEVRKMLVRVIGEDIKLTTDLAPDLRRVNVDPGQWNQVLMNLALNARDAMPRGGSLRIETANVAPGSRVSRGGVSSAPLVRISVSDNGCGMSSEVKARVFQPFFTTKEVGKGTGLGLAVVHGIVTQSEGFIDVESEAGQGARFDIYLPAAGNKTAEASAAESAAAKSSASRRASVLVVEDDEAVRRLAKRILGARGYDVVTASDARDALERIATRPTAFDIVVTDVVMPGLNGRELAERIRIAHPNVRVLYVSGYMDDAIVRNGIATDEIHFLAKPYSPDALATAVAHVLTEDVR